MTNATKAIGLMSGGLDSSLAVKLMIEQGIEVIGIYCRHPFHTDPPPGTATHAERAARELGVELVMPDVTDAMLELVRDPPHGHGKHLNPCMDCRILYLEEAKKLMNQRGASFLFTGEVLGQRPMSQRRDAMNAIDRDSALRGLVARPLCAKNLSPTIPEEKGLIDREKLLGITGRGRNEQMALANKYGLREYAPPAGGCLLTMEGFARKTQDLLDHAARLRKEDVELLKLGRHFRLSSAAKLVVGRDKRENQELLRVAEPRDTIIRSHKLPGPVSLIRGIINDDVVHRALSIAATYVKKGGEGVNFQVSRSGSGMDEVNAKPLDRFKIEEYRI